MLVLTKCPVCKQESAVEVSQLGYEMWKQGALIQDAFPTLSTTDREKLMTGICGSCWDRMWSEEEEES